MIEQTRVDLWNYHAEKAWICITTNYGWRADRWAVMGAGVAAQARDRYPSLCREYGSHCYKNHKTAPEDKLIGLYVDWPLRIICFATKELNIDKPWLSWMEKSSIDQIEFSARCLYTWIESNKIVTRIYLPRPGCSNGGLKWKDVKPILNFLPDNVIVVTNEDD